MIKNMVKILDANIALYCSAFTFVDLRVHSFDFMNLTFPSQN